MYFVVRNNKFYTMAARIKPLYRYAITLISLFFLSCAWLYGVYYPLNTVINSYCRDIVQLRKKARDRHVIDQECAQLTNKIHASEDALKQCGHGQSDVQLAQSHLFFIVQQAKKIGLQFHGCNARHSVHHDWYTSHENCFDFSGTLQQMSLFLTALQESQKMLQCYQLSVQHTDGAVFAINCSLHTTIIA